LYKEEHRLIAEEGVYDLVFTAPTYDIDGNIEDWPTIRLGSGDEREFKILQTKSMPYSSYDTSRVEWVDEGDDNVYRITTVSAGWIHSIGGAYSDYGNMLYDAEAVNDKQAAVDAEREIVLSYDMILEEEESYVYNRGVVANLYKNRLKYLPYQETELSVDPGDISYNPALEEGDISNALPEGTMAWWCYDDTMIIDFSFGSDTFCVNRVEVEGFEGNLSVTISGTDEIEKYHINQPSIYLYEKISGSWSSSVLESRQGLRMSELEKKGGFGLTTWEKNIDIELSPTRMITHKAEAFRVKFVMAGTEKECVAIKSVKLYYAEYESRTEKVKLWERKYNVSRGTVGDYNPDGVDRVLSFEHNKDNSGVYYLEYVDAVTPLGSYNKMRRIFGNEHHEDEEVISVSSPSSVVAAEKEQELLYSDAYEQEPGDSTDYKSTVPPPIKSNYLFNNSNMSSLNGLDVTVTSEKTKWANHIENAGYQEYSLWYPQGHFYRWSPTYKTVRCYLGGEFFEVAQLEFLDVANNESKAAATGYQAYYSGRAWHILKQLEKDLIVGGNDTTRQANQQSFRGGADLMTRPG